MFVHMQYSQFGRAIRCVRRSSLTTAVSRPTRPCGQKNCYTILGLMRDPQLTNKAIKKACARHQCRHSNLARMYEMHTGAHTRTHTHHGCGKKQQKS